MAINSDYMLPYLVRNIPQISDLLQAEQKEIDSLQELISSTHDELYISSCIDLIGRYEQIFNIDYSDFLTLEERRLNIIVKLTLRSNTTIQALKDIVFIISGCDSEIIEYYSEYSFLVNILLDSDGSTQSTNQVVSQINIMKPAHLLYVLSFKIDPITVQNPNNFNFYKFKVKARFNNWGFQKNIYLDGDNILSGSWVLGHEYKHIKLHKFKVKSSIQNENVTSSTKFKVKASIQNENTSSININYRNQILLNDNLLLNGTWLLNS